MPQASMYTPKEPNLFQLCSKALASEKWMPGKERQVFQVWKRKTLWFCVLIQVELKGANDNELQAYTLTGKHHTRKLYRASRHHLKTERWTSLKPQPQPRIRRLQLSKEPSAQISQVSCEVHSTWA